MKRFCAAMIFLQLAATAAGAQPAPGIYRVDGKPVPSSCLSALGMGDSRSDPIDLAHCGDPGVKPKTQGGMIGYDDPQGGYFYYRYLGQASGLDVLSLLESGGGSGSFTSLVGVRHEGHVLKLAQDFAGGDRCNGGISHETVKNGTLSFDANMTPYDLIALADGKTKLQAYKDLEASAASCIGQVHYTQDDKHWTGVALTETSFADQKGWTEQYRYQACFNALYRQSVVHGPVELNRPAVMAFAARFNAQCVKGKS